MMASLDGPIICPVFVGRAPQLAAARQVIERAGGGRGQPLLIAGEAGVGKTRLVAEVSAQAAAGGYRPLRGACFPDDGASPYAPLLDLLRAHCAGRSPEAIIAELGPAAPTLAPLLAGALAAPLALDPLPALEPAQEKRRLFAALLQFFFERAARAPALVVIEDLHWSDDTSLEFLHHLARACPGHSLLLLLTYRPDEAPPRLRRWLAMLDRERLAHELRLPRLTRDEVAGMLRAIFALERPARAEFVEAVYGLTDGNPFFIEETLASLIATGDVFIADGGWDRKPIGELRIPRSVQAAVQARAERLSPPARRLLSLAAVAGRRVDFALLRELTQGDEHHLLARLKELIAAGLVIEESDEVFAFRHALTQQAIEAELLGRERRTLHGLVADAIERCYGGAPEPHLADLARHAYRAGRWEAALACARRAGERALALYAPREAIEHLTHALEAAERLALDAPADLLRQRGQAREWVGDFEGARADHEAALAAARAGGDRRAEWQALLDLGLLWAGRDYERSQPFYEAALARARAMGEPITLGHSLNRLGNWHANADRPQEGLRYHQEALNLFRERADRPGLAATQDLLGVTSYLAGDFARSAGHLEQAVTLFEALDDRRGLASSLTTLSVLSGHYPSATMAAPALTLAEGTRHAERGLAILREIGWRSGEAYARALLASSLGASGRYGQALPLAQGALALAEEIEHRAWMSIAHLILAMLHLDLLEPTAARRHGERGLALAEQLGSLYRRRSVAGHLALIYLQARDLARAEAVLDSVLRPDAPARTLGERLCWRARAELALARDQPGAALAIVDRLIAESANVEGRAEQAIPHLGLLRGETLRALRRPAEAEAALLAARGGAIGLGIRPLLWRVHAALGRLYRATGRHADAGREAAAAQELVVELAATAPDGALRDTFLSRAAMMAPRPMALTPLRAAKQEYGGLTMREREVTALVARGLTNQEIATALSVGKRTVETHIGSILAKLNLDSRAQVIAWALKRDLATPTE
jgi:DNA-binding CsgD family transcriptional regulator